jgi:hypothetical protein
MLARRVCRNGAFRLWHEACSQRVTIRQKGSPVQTTERQAILPSFSGEGMISFQASARARRAGERWAAFGKPAAATAGRTPAPASMPVPGPAPANLRVLRDLLSLAQKG